MTQPEMFHVEHEPSVHSPRIFNLAELVSYLRQQSNLTQAQLARKARLSRTTVLYLENELGTPYARTIQKIVASFPAWADTLVQHDTILRKQAQARSAAQRAKYSHLANSDNRKFKNKI